MSGWAPRIARSRLVLPAPLGPSTATNSPGRTVRFSCDHRVREPKLRLASRTDRIGGAGAMPRVCGRSEVAAVIGQRSGYSAKVGLHPR